MFNLLNEMNSFFKEPNREVNVREFARMLKISPATASKNLKLMTKKGLLIERKERNLILYKANLDNDAYLDLKIYYNIRKIKESGLLRGLNDYYLKPTIVLFGSCAYGLDTEISDIDLLIISEKTSIVELKKYERKLKSKVQLFVVKKIKDLQNEHLMNNIMNGIIIQGRVKWI